MLWSPKGSHSLPSAPRHVRTGPLLLALETQQALVPGVQGFQNERLLDSTHRTSWKTLLVPGQRLRLCPSGSLYVPFAEPGWKSGEDLTLCTSATVWTDLRCEEDSIIAQDEFASPPSPSDEQQSDSSWAEREETYKGAEA